jgi:single-stranded-DNA-specific exonuclease
MPEQQQWNLLAVEQPPEWFVQTVKHYIPNTSGKFAAQLLWQRGIREASKLEAFINPQTYQPASAFEFGEEMQLAVARLQKAREKGEKVTIWGDFDADGITSTSVLWDGLGQFFVQYMQLDYYIPNRMTESHGLNIEGIDKLAQQGCQLIVTCDTGSTNLEEITYAKQLNIDVIVTDHHTLPNERPAVVAIINPRYLPKEHPLYNLSGVAVAYKLVEGLYQSLPDVPQQPLEDLLDLVAVGLIADLVQLNGDCRYLAQQGIQQLQDDFKQLPEKRRRPGVGRLLELCQKSGDRPTDISFGLGPRINAVSRIQGDARFCVELLTSRNLKRVQELAELAELANSRRKSLQKDIAEQVKRKLSQIDLSTTSVIVLEDPQWAVGVLGLVAGQIAQETGRPTILLSTEAGEGERESNTSPTSPTPYSPLPTPLARGSARSINSVDLYQLVKDQAHLLHRFGGHPFAAGLSLPSKNIPLFTQAINQRLRQTLGGVSLVPTIQADITVTVANLGKDLFLELKILEPCGMGNPVPKLLIQNCWFENSWHRNQDDSKGKKIQYIKTDFDIRDDSCQSPFPGVWWGHYKDELPTGRCDCIAELDYNTFKKRYEIRLVAVRASANSAYNQSTSAIPAFDWRNFPTEEYLALNAQQAALLLKDCPTSWDEIRIWIRKSYNLNQPLALAWSTPKHQPPQEVWLNLAGFAKYLNRTQQSVTRSELLKKLNISDQSLFLGLKALRYLGLKATLQDNFFIFIQIEETDRNIAQAAVENFLEAIQEEQFQRDYFTKVPISTILAIVPKG